MKLGPVFIDQIEQQPANGFFETTEASPVDTNNLLRAIELDIQARREAIANIALWQRVGEQDAKAGHTLAAARCVQNVARASALLAEIQSELGRLFIQAAQAFGNQARKNGA